MTQKIAVAIIHGIGRSNPHFADEMMAGLTEKFSHDIDGYVQNPEQELVFETAFWDPVIKNEEEKLWQRVHKGGALDFEALRRFIIDFAGAAIAYQPTPRDKRIYDCIHHVVSVAIKKLSQSAGHQAPLCVIANSIGTIIAHNYITDLQAYPWKKLLLRAISLGAQATPIEKGDTLAHFYTLGSPLALWSLQYADFGTPIAVPSANLKKYYHAIEGEWVNYYNDDDVIAYPLKTINDAFNAAVKEDRVVQVGNILTNWNPVSHLGYWSNKTIIESIASSLAQTWLAINTPAAGG
jgi:hypothetical protein